jgi:hypothetical protein
MDKQFSARNTTQIQQEEGSRNANKTGRKCAKADSGFRMREEMQTA